MIVFHCFKRVYNVSEQNHDYSLNKLTDLLVEKAQSSFNRFFTKLVKYLIPDKECENRIQRYDENHLW
jgi:hypothetical protein